MDLPKKGEVVPLDVIEKICFEYSMYDLWAKIKNNPPGKPFKSDGCSGGWPDQWKGRDLYPACFKHDLKYWAGYLKDDDVDRLLADADLMINVVVITQNVELAQVMFAGVRAGGETFWGKSYSWGFGRV